MTAVAERGAPARSPRSSGGEVCRCCGSTEVEIFHEVADVPVNSVLSVATRAEAVGFPRSELRLGFCRRCAFVYNTAFVPELLEYSERYDPSQSFSPTFNAWHRGLAEKLIERYDLRGKRIIEIGCGKGEFLTLLCELGDNEGLGFDPAYVAHEAAATDSRARFMSDFYSEKYGHERGDFICCKMTLEHIQQAGSFVESVRRTVGDAEDTVVFFQVPDVTRILEELAFWDVYYEHCSYFSTGSLGRLFRSCGFSILDLERDYDGQYLMVAARPARSGEDPFPDGAGDLERLADLVEHFRRMLPETLAAWRARLEAEASRGRRVVIWGAGSKGVAFLTTLGAAAESVEYAVDINPRRAGLFMPGTGHQIVGPGFLEEYRPDVVVVMNPIYRREIVEDLSRRGLEPQILTT